MSDDLDTLRRAVTEMRAHADRAQAMLRRPWTERLTSVSPRPHYSLATQAHHLALAAPGINTDLAAWLNQAATDLWAHGPLHCDNGCHECDDDLWAPHVRCALTVARAYLAAVETSVFLAAETTTEKDQT